MAHKIQIRRDTASAWTSANPTLGQGEMGYETDSGKMKIGDGTTTWTSLSYYEGSITKAMVEAVLTGTITSHNHSGAYEPVFSKNNAFNKSFGTGSDNVCVGNDSRLGNTRTPSDDSITPAKLHDEFTDTDALSGTAVDWSAAFRFTKTITANTTLTFSNLHVGIKLLEITGDFAITLPTGFIYAGGERADSGATLIQIICTDTSSPKGWYIILKDES